MVLLAVIVTCLTLLSSAAAQSACQAYEPANVVNWSTLYGLDSLDQPLHINGSRHVLFDVPSVHVNGGIVIELGSSLFFHDQGINGLSATLATDFITVHGRLQAGSPSCPFKSDVTFYMFGLAQGMAHPPQPNIKSITVQRGGALELHGAKGLGEPSGNGISWTRLEGSIQINATSMRLNDTVINRGSDGMFDWQVGDRLILSTTDLDPHMSEVVTITSLTDDRTVQFSPPLTYSHFGDWSVGVDMRASVGLLTRNIMLTTNEERWPGTSDPLGAPGTLGTHIMIMSGFAAARGEGIAIKRGGQGDFQARYPWHWHLCGDVTGQDSYFRSSTIDDSYFRGVTIHGTQGALVKDNVFWNIMGHVFFLEDGSEFGNTIDHNLVVLNKVKMTGFALDSDMAAEGLSVYWLTNPNNTFINNVLAGGEGAGCWVNARGAVEGLSSLSPLYVGYQPNRAPQATFERNIFHSFQRGINMEFRIQDNDKIPPPNDLNQRHTNVAGLQPPNGRPVHINNVYWKIRDEGYWSRFFSADVINCTFADCGGDSVQIAGSGGHPLESGAARIVNTVFIGQTENHGNRFSAQRQVGANLIRFQTWYTSTEYPQGFASAEARERGTGSVGFRIYDGPIYVVNCTFINYKSVRSNRGSWNDTAISPRNGNAFFMQSLTLITGSKFINTEFRFMVLSDGPNMNQWSDGSRNTVIYDKDGSISGHPYFYCTNTRFDYFLAPGCVHDPSFGRCCPQQYFTSQMLCMDNNMDFGVTGSNICPKPNNFHQIRRDVPESVGDLAYQSDNWDMRMENGNNDWHTIWGVNASYLMYFSHYTPTYTGFQIASTYRGDWMNFAMCMDPAASVVQAYRGRCSPAYGVSPVTAIYSQYSPIQAVSTYAEFQALGATTNWPHAGGYYYVDTVRHIVHVHVQSRATRIYAEDDLRSNYGGMEGCDFIIIQFSEGHNAPNNCSAAAFSDAYPDGDLQITDSDYLRSVSVGPRVNGSYQLVECDGCLFVDAGSDGFYIAQSAPPLGLKSMTDDRGIYWEPDTAYQVTDRPLTFRSGLDNRIFGDDDNKGYMLNSALTGDWEMRAPLSNTGVMVLTLYFVEIFWREESRRLFDVLVDGQTAVACIDQFQESGGVNHELAKRLFINVTAINPDRPYLTMVPFLYADGPSLAGFSFLPLYDFVSIYPDILTNSISSGIVVDGTLSTPEASRQCKGFTPGGGGGGGGGSEQPNAEPAFPIGPPVALVPNAVMILAGAQTASAASAERGWQGDALFATGGGMSAVPYSTLINVSPAGAQPLSLELTAPVFYNNRFGNSQWHIPVAESGVWTLRLLFAENYWSTPGSRVFRVTAQGNTIINGLDLNLMGAKGDGFTSGYIYQTLVYVGDSSLRVDLEFITIADNALVCGIVLLPPSHTLTPSSTGSVVASSSSSVSISSSSSVDHVSSSSSSDAPTSVSSSSSAGSVDSSSSDAPIIISSSSSSAPSPSPAAGLFINCASTQSFTDSLGRVWQADRYYVSNTMEWQGPSNQAYTNTVAELYPLYNSNRYNSPTYTIPVTVSGVYTVELHMAEIYWTQVGARVFDIVVQDVVIATNVDIYAQVGAAFAAYVFTTQATVTSDAQFITISLVNRVDLGLLSAIAVTLVE